MALTGEQFAELEAIRKRNPDGLLLIEDVVKAARSKKSSLHTEFEWDDAKAAEKWREEQARNLIRAHVTYEPRVARETRGYLSVPTDRENGGGYRPTSEVLSRPELEAQCVEEMRKTMLGMRARFSYLPRRFDGLWDEIECVLARYFTASDGTGKKAA